MATADSITYREIVRFPGYRFGSDGSVWTKRTHVWLGHGRGTQAVFGEWKQKTSCIDRTGYPYVSVVDNDGKHKSRIHVHRLITEAFYGPLPKGLATRHLDGVKTNNAITNIVYGTYSENYNDKRKHGASQAGDKHGNAKLDWAKVRIIRRARRRGIPGKVLADRFGVTVSVICSVYKQVTWNARN